MRSDDTTMRTLPTVAMLLVLTICSHAQQEAPEEGPYQRARIVAGVGRAHLAITTTAPEGQAFFDQGLALLHAGDDFEAGRSFRELATRDPECAMAWWGMALAGDGHPSRALEFCWHAHRLRARANDFERSFIDAWARALGALEEPEWELVDAETGRRRARPRDAAHGRRPTLVRDLERIAAGRSVDPEPLALLVRERTRGLTPGANRRDERSRTALETLLRLSPQHPAHRYRSMVADVEVTGPDSAWRVGLAAPAVGRAWEACAHLMTDPSSDVILAREAAMRADHASLLTTRSLPCEVEGYARNVEGLARSYLAAGHVEEARTLARKLTALPRHPRHEDGAMHRGARLLIELAAAAPAPPRLELVRDPPPGLPARLATAPATWSPPPAPALALPRGDGGVLDLASFAGRPVLVVFFLGFGCIHCVEQLGELSPRAADFERAGITVVSIGSDTIDQVRASRQRALENDTPPVPFPVLCDPKGAAFKAWSCWDEFADEALHGTFLVDAKGRVRWRDVGIEPFMETDFLLAECVRLLAVEDT